MKKLIFAALAAGVMFAAPALHAAEPMPYKSDIGANGKLAAGWSQTNTTDHEWVYDDSSDFSTPETEAGMRHTYESPAADAMLISPAFNMTAGTTYTAGFWVKTDNSWGSDVEAFKFYMGTEGTMDALKLTEPLVEREDYVNNYDFELIKVTFNAAADGDYHFGIYCCSKPWQGTLCVTGFFVNEGNDRVVVEKPVEEVEIPYTADFSIKAGFNQWTSAAGDDAVVTSKWNHNSWSKYAEFDRTDGLREDNYFISPAINVTQAGPYAIDFTYTAYGTFDLVIGTDIHDLKSFDKVLYTVEGVTDFEVSTQVNVDLEPGKYFVAMHLRAEVGSYMGYRLHAFKIKSDLPVPALVNDLVADADHNDALKVALSWTNPAKTHIGTDLDKIEKVEIMRNGELLATLTDGITPGAAATYVDEPATAGVYTYSVVVYGENGTFDGEPLAASAGYVGRPVTDFPFSLNVTYADADHLAMYTSVDANNNGRTWEVAKEYYSVYFTSANSTDNEATDLERTADNYLASPYIHLTPGYYLFTSSISSRCNTFEVGYATDRHDLPGTFVKLGGIENQQEYSFNPCEVVIPIDVEGDYCLVWRHVGESTTYVYNKVSLEKASLVAQDLLPALASELLAESEAGTHVVELSWINPVLDNANRELTSISKVEILRDGNLVGTVTSDLTPGAVTFFTDTVDEDGTYTYTVVVYNENGCSTAEAPQFSLFVGTGREMPYEADFNEWTIIHNGGYWDPSWTVDANGAACFARDYLLETMSEGIYSPHLYLKGGYVYYISFTTFGKSDDNDGEFELRAGKVMDNMETFATVSHSGSAAQNHSISVYPKTAAEMAEGDNSQIVIPAGNVMIGLHIFKNGDANVRDFRIERGPAITGIADMVADSEDVLTCVDGVVYFAADLQAATVADLTGRVLYTAAAGTQSVNLHALCTSGVVIVKAVTADGRTASLKVAL